MGFNILVYFLIINTWLLVQEKILPYGYDLYYKYKSDKT